MKGIIKEFLQRRLGISYLRDEIIQDLSDRVNTLSYFLNEFVDITSIPPTRNKDLRIMQECDALLLALFDKICKKYGLTYWLSFDKLLAILKSEFEKSGFTVSDFDKPGYIIGFGYQHEKTGIWLDVFPVDVFP